MSTNQDGSFGWSKAPTTNTKSAKAKANRDGNLDSEAKTQYTSKPADWKIEHEDSDFRKPEVRLLFVIR
jgi:hypothetical protein